MICPIRALYSTALLREPRPPICPKRPFSRFPTHPHRRLRCSALWRRCPAVPIPDGGGKKKHGLQPVVLIMIGLIRGCHGFHFRSPGGLRRGLKGVLCDTARMARLMAALVFKLIPSSCRRLFFCVPLGATSLHARIFVCICSFATEGRLNGVTDKKFLFWGRKTYTEYSYSRMWFPLSL